MTDWNHITLRATDIPFAAMPLVDALQSIHLNGGAQLGGFVAHEPSDWWAVDAIPDEDDCSEPLPPPASLSQALGALLVNPAVRSGMPELKIPEQVDIESWDATNCLTMEGELTHRLLLGGAYDCFGGGIDEARRLSREFTNALFGDRLLQVAVYHSDRAWSPWFADVAWDATYLMRDMEAGMFWVLAITDSD